MKVIHGPVEIFACYAREDEALLNELEKHLSSLQRENTIEFWYDRKINPGANWQQEIQKHLHAAHIILFLVSSDFIHSDYCYSIEMQQAMQRHQNGNVCIIPIILRPVFWQNTPFGKLQALPADAKPVIGPDWPDPEVALNNVAEGIRKIVTELKGETASAASLKIQTAATMKQFATPPVSTGTRDSLSTPSFRAAFPQLLQTRLRKRMSGLSIASILVLVFALILMGISARVLLSGSSANSQNHQVSQQTISHGQATSRPTLAPTAVPTPTPLPKVVSVNRQLACINGIGDNCSIVITVISFTLDSVQNQTSMSLLINSQESCEGGFFTGAPYGSGSEGLNFQDSTGKTYEPGGQLQPYSSFSLTPGQPLRLTAIYPFIPLPNSTYTLSSSAFLCSGDPYDHQYAATQFTF